jgi:hypothetical protein
VKRLALLAAALPALAGCAEDTAASSPPVPPATVTVTATATATATVTATASPDRRDLAELIELLDELPDPAPVSPSATAPPPRLTLRVYQDGCGVIRSRPATGVTYQNLTWSVRDEGGFQVLGRNAEGETRYRYFQSGTYTVVLQAFVNGAYRPVSNTVTIRC